MGTSVPACMKRRPFGRRKFQNWASQIKGKQARDLLKGVLELAKISGQARRPELSEEIQEQFCDSNPPLPALLAVFAESDGIGACFDEDQQTALVRVHTRANVIIPLNAHEPASVYEAFHTFGVLCDTLAAASRLIDLMPGNEQWVREK